MNKVREKHCDSFPEVAKLINALIDEINDLQFEVAKLGAVKDPPPRSPVAKPKPVTAKTKGD
jgi:hypothetical protein